MLGASEEGLLGWCRVICPSLLCLPCLVSRLLLCARVKATSNLQTILAGVSWTGSASELWIAGQRSMPDWARGRMNAVHMIASQGGVAVGGVIWGAAAASLGLGATLVGGAFLLAASLALAIPLSINFAQRLELIQNRLKRHTSFRWRRRRRRACHGHRGARHSSGRPGRVPRPDWTTSTDLLTQWGFSLPGRRILEHPGTFRTEMRVNSWAEHLRQHARMTKAETEIARRVRAMHSGEQELVVRHSLPTNQFEAAWPRR
jgi:hypothetical protein